MKINSIKKTLKISILMTVILALPIMYTMATESAITYTISEDKKSAVIHIDVNKVIGSNDLVEVKDQDNNLLTAYDIRVTENGTYSYTVTYKEKVITETEVMSEETVVENKTDEVTPTSDTQEVIGTSEVPEEETIIKNEILEIKVDGIVTKEELLNQQIDTQSIVTEESSVSQNETTPLEASEVTSTAADLFTFDKTTKTITGYTGTSTDIIIPETIDNTTVENIGDNVFKDLGITSVEFPSTIKKIGQSAFYKHKLQSLTLPESLEIIDESAFQSGILSKVHIPQSVQRINFFAFSGNDISELTFSQNCKLVIEGHTFHGNKIKTLDLSVGNITFGGENLNGTEKFSNGSGAFQNNEIETVKFSRYFTYIPHYVFCGNKIKNLEIPSYIQEIGVAAFADNDLTHLTLNEGLRIIHDQAFAWGSTNRIVIPNSVLQVAPSAFEGCSLYTVTLNDYVNVVAFVDGNPYKSIALYQMTYPNIIKRKGEWSLDLKTLDSDLDLNRVVEVNAANEGKIGPYSELSSIDGSYDPDTGNVVFTSDPLGKSFMYYYRVKSTDTEIKQYMSVIINMDNIVSYTDVHFDSVNAKEVIVGKTYGELPVPSSRVGYNFKEWNTSSDGMGDTITADTVVSNENEHTLYPIFAPISYEVTLIAGNHQEVKNIFYDSTYGDLPVIEKSGYDFMGWNTQSDGKGKYITKDTILDKAENQTIYAIYKKRAENKPDNNQTPDGDIILPGEDGKPGTNDDIIVKPGIIDENGNVIISDGGTIIYPNGDKEEFPNGGIIIPGEDGKMGTSDDIIVKPATIDDKGNIIIPDGGTIIYPDGSHEDFPDGGIILPGEDGELGTKDDIIVKPGTIDDKGNIIIPDGGTIIYPDGNREDFPNGGIILPGEDDKLGTKDDIIVKPGTIDDKGNIIIPNGGVIICPDGRREEFPNGGTLYAGMDGVFGTQDDLLIRNIKEDSSNTINISTDNNNNKRTITDNTLTSDDTQVLLWSFIGVVSIFGAIASVKKKLKL